jgi:hypothetical protein
VACHRKRPSAFDGIISTEKADWETKAMYGIYEVVCNGTVVERQLRHVYGIFTTEEQARQVLETLGEEYSVDEVAVG